MTAAVQVYIDGVAWPCDTASIPVADRGLHYGDGLFETMRILDGSVRFLDDHLERLRLSSGRLGIPLPSTQAIADEIAHAALPQNDGVIKLIVSRGDGPRGYRSPAAPRPRRILWVYGAAPKPSSAPITVRWCETPVARNPVLAGIKHLNRLEQVLARSEWRDPAIAEGLMLDTEGEVVCGTTSNVFAVVGGTLCTPDLRFAGVHGIMRRRVLRTARELGVAVAELPMRPPDFESASEVFVTNAVAGLRPVGRLGAHEWQPGPKAAALASALALW